VLLQVYPDKGTVSFSAGLHAWAFTLTTFAQMYAAKFGTAESKMMEKLWGDNFFDPATKKWTKKATDSKTCQRGFVQFCYNPIKQVRPTTAPSQYTSCELQRSRHLFRSQSAAACGWWKDHSWLAGRPIRP
jgi:hypothetical protein